MIGQIRLQPMPADWMDGPIQINVSGPWRPPSTQKTLAAFIGAA